MEPVSLVGAAAGVVLTSGVVSALVAGAFGKRSERLARRSKAASDAIDALATLLIGYRDPSKSPEELWALEELFLAAVAKANFRDLRKQAGDLVEGCRRFKAGDPYYGLADLEVARGRVDELLARRLKRVN